MSKNLFKSIFDFYLYSNLHVAICGVALTNVSCKILHLPFSTETILISFFGPLAFYCFQRLVGVLKHEREDFLGERNQWNFRNKNVLIGSIAISVFPLAYSFFQLTFQSKFLLVGAFVLSLIYATPIFKIKGKKIRLRDFSFVKIFFITIVWVIVSTLFPVMQSHAWYMANIEKLHAVLVWSAVEFLFLFALIIPFDIRDMDFDPPSIRSLPMLIGEKKSLALSKFLLVISCGIFWWGFEMTHDFNFYQIVFYFLWVAFSIWILKDCSKKSSEYYFSFLLDGLLVALWVFIYYANCISNEPDIFFGS